MSSRDRHVRTTRVEVSSNRGVFMISVAAELADMHPQTLRMYEQRGLIRPQRSPRGTRLYSHRDVERLRRIQEMTAELGMNLAGVERVFELEEQLEAASAKVRRLERRARDLQQEVEKLEELRRSVQPLARVLATRLSARRRRRRRGKIDMRRTLRRAMGTGGVPMRPVYEKPRPARPELVLICDVSGSVAGFSNFTMLLVQALSAQFSKVRVFAFVNAMAEVTDIVRDGAVGGGADIEPRIRAEARITKWHTSSDYGEAFLDFREFFLDAVGPRTAVLILGDARNNNQNPRFDALHEIAMRSRRTYWLNPEHHTRWGLGDSEAQAYAEIVPMHECANVDQLTHFVTRLLPV